MKYKFTKMTHMALTDSSGSSKATPVYLPDADSSLRPEVP